MRIVFCFLAMITLSACNSSESNQDSKELTTDSAALKFVQSIESVHNKELFKSYDAVQFDMELIYRGKKKFRGRVYMTTDGKQIKAEGEKNVMYWNGEKGVVLPDTSDNPKVRSALLTWSYFFAVPYKLSDPGTKHQYLGEKSLRGDKYEASKLTFAKEVGDSPDDWYILYKGDGDVLAGMAYIVTGKGSSKKEAEKDPHAITYEAFVDIGGIPFATQWNFWTWNEGGSLNKLLGNASIGNVQFMKKVGNTFQLATDRHNR